MMAANKGFTQIVKLLLEKGADIDAKGESGWTALMNATGHPDIVKLLLEHGADVNAKNVYGKTALDRAKVRNQSEMIKLLEAKGATTLEKSGPLNADSIIKERWRIQKTYENANYDGDSFKNASKSNFSKFFKFDPRTLMDKLDEAPPAADIEDITRYFGQLQNRRSYFVGGDCSSDTLYELNYEKGRIMLEGLPKYLLLKPGFDPSIIEFSFSMSVDELVSKFGKPYERNGLYVSFLVFDPVKAYGNGKKRAYSPLVYFYMNNSGIEKVFVHVPYIC